MNLSLTTELDAINSMLTVIGEAPVNSVDDTGLVDAVTARQILHETMRHVQSKGWSWNADQNVAFLPTFPLPGKIHLPANTLRAAPTNRAQRHIIQRGLTLWDKERQSFLFDAPVRLDIVRLLPFEELPQVARHYIMIRSARIFQDRVVGSSKLSGLNAADEGRAFADLRSAEAEVADYNILDSAMSMNILGYPDRA